MLLTLAVLVAPCTEELLVRGFLYRAWRRSHGVLVSTCLVLCLHFVSHYSTVTRSVFVLLCLDAVEVTLCQIRERTKSTWNCVLCHSAYNAAQTPGWPSLLGQGMLLIPLFLFFWYRNRAPLNGAEQTTDTP
jgi:membrane protease YdiL (CAAX protease family)